MFAFRRLVLVGLALLCCGPFSARGADKEYKVVLTRPTKVGAKAKVSGGFTMEMRIALRSNGQDQDPKVVAMGLLYEGQSRVLAVDARGQVTKMTVTFDKCVITTDKGNTETLPKGSVVMIEFKDGLVAYERKDGPLSDGAKAVLHLAEFAVKEPGATDDEAFGTAQKQKIGGQWPVNAEVVAKDLVRQGATADPKDVKGQGTLVGAKVVNGVPCLDIAVEVSNEHFKPPLVAEPHNQGVYKFTMTGLFPEDVAIPATQEARTTSLDLLSDSVPGDRGIVFHQTMKMSTTAQTTPIK